MIQTADLHDIVFVTDKYGRRNKTCNIEKLYKENILRMEKQYAKSRTVNKRTYKTSQ